ncbi:hypothetical protein DSO57_1030694 [Entomophthora muscae]|uniref:Uncharacterized protein n=1 Tax=Entomophthora muscae TaxID=34485 RepID=A0ACC2TN07_9FUNG|nr:hypothetical protein DSO57_1030694 [Entomophthora muscae]
MIPSEAVKLDPSPPSPGPLPVTDSSCPILALLKNPEPSPTSLEEQVLLAQPLSPEYPRLIKLAASNGNTTPQDYQENTGILLHMGKWWVPEAPLRQEVIKEHHESLALGHLGKTKTIELICHSYS